MREMPLMKQMQRLLSLALALALALCLMPATAFAQAADNQDDAASSSALASAESVTPAQEGDTASTANATVPSLSTLGDDTQPSEDDGTLPEPEDPPAPVFDKSAVSLSLTGKYRNVGAEKNSSSATVAASTKLFFGSLTGTTTLQYLYLKLGVPSEALENGYTAGISYRCRIDGTWTGWTSNYAVLGKSGKNFEALQVKLTGDAADYYDIYYQLNFRSIGTLDWAKNGATAGIYSYGNKVRGVRLMLKKKGSSAPGSTKTPVLTTLTSSGTVTVYKGSARYSTANLAKTAGKTGCSGLSKLRVSVSSPFGGGVAVSVYERGRGWSKYSAAGKTAGVSSKKITGVKMKCTGGLATRYNVWYRVYAKGYGWMGWTYGGKRAGTDYYSIPVTAIQVRLWTKGVTPNLSKTNAYSGKGGVLCEVSYTKTLVKRVKNVYSSTGWCIIVDTNFNRVGVFKGSKGNWSLYKYFPCTSGAWGSPTVKGSFTVGARGLAFGKPNQYTCWYYTQFCGNYLFHSVLYAPGSATQVIDGRLGINASHGCVRLAKKNAKWIYDTIPYGTKVKIY